MQENLNSFFFIRNFFVAFSNIMIFYISYFLNLIKKTYFDDSGEPIPFINILLNDSIMKIIELVDDY